MNPETFLNQFLNFEKSRHAPFPGRLDRMRHLLARCGDPQKRFDCILVAGSKGKGSTAAMIASILKASGRRTGLYTSPHLVDLAERIQIDGQNILQEELTAQADDMEAILSNIDLPFGKPTYFEVLTAMALRHFAGQNVQTAVLEIGLGGALDATNACEPVLSVLTPLGFEHTDVLGSTIEEIAAAKCGILRAGVPAVVSPQSGPAMKAIIREARLIGAPVHPVENGLVIRDAGQSVEGQRFEIEGPWGMEGPFQIPLLGWHQVQNAATACLAARIFSWKRAPAISAAAIQEGLKNLEWPGRLEVLSRDPWIVIDGAHTGESAEALAAALSRHFADRPIHWIVGMMSDKDPSRFLKPLQNQAASFTFVPVPCERSFLPEDLAYAAEALGLRARTSPSCERALDEARGEAGEGGLVVVTGSIYLAGQAKEVLKHAAQTAG